MRQSRREQMVNEVESILNEIRDRVRTDHEQGRVPVTLVTQVEKAKDSLVPSRAEGGSSHTESLSRLSAHLTTTGRAWDRLPPMYSNRKGGAARFELWIKARLKSMSRWFTWEQVNFNSAVHHALSETLQALSAYQQELAELGSELREEGESWRKKLEHSNRELTALRSGIEAELRKRDAAMEARTAELASAMNDTRAELTSRLAELAGELRESDQQLREEQRVCFKQLSLETSEATVMEDRGRRVIESRLDKLERALANGEQ
jgi:hypothetical protein